MSIETEKYVRKPLYVDVVEVTADNMSEVARWCEGDVHIVEKHKGNKDGVERYIKVPVHMPRTDRQTKGFVGDFILHTNGSFKVYTKKAFESSFEKVIVTQKDTDNSTTVYREKTVADEQAEFAASQQEDEADRFLAEAAGTDA